MYTLSNQDTNFYKFLLINKTRKLVKKLPEIYTISQTVVFTSYIMYILFNKLLE